MWISGIHCSTFPQNIFQTLVYFWVMEELSHNYIPSEKVTWKLKTELLKTKEISKKK